MILKIKFTTNSHEIILDDNTIAIDPFFLEINGDLTPKYIIDISKFGKHISSIIYFKILDNDYDELITYLSNWKDRLDIELLKS